MSYYIYRCFSHSAQQKFPISHFFIRALYPWGFHQLLPLQSGAVLVLGPVSARCLWQLDDVAPQGWKKKSDGSSASQEKKRCRFFDLMYPQFLEMEENALQSSCSVYVCDDERTSAASRNLRAFFVSCHFIRQALWAVKVLIMYQKLLFLLAATHRAQIISLFANLYCRVEIQSSVGFARIFESFSQLTFRS